MKKEFVNKVILRSCNSGSQPYERQSGRDAETLRAATPFSMTLSNRGFTLIELLVVVLIIGILAAVALPQYEKAVTKARFSQIILGARSIYNAQKIYFMANGEYADTFDKLDIEPTGKKVTDKYVYWNRGLCYNIGANRLDCGAPSKEKVIYTIWYKSGEQWCCSYPDDKYAGDWLCKGVLGGEMRQGHTSHCWKSR